MLAVGSQRRYPNLKPGTKEYEFDNSLDIPKFNHFKEVIPIIELFSENNGR